MLVPRLVNSSKLLRLIKYLVIVLFLLLLVPYLNTPEVHDAYVDVLRSFQDAKRLFLQDFMAHDIEARVPNHGLQLAKLCANKTWFPEDKAVVLTCDPLSGGLGGVKNGHLNCIRFAIEVGGGYYCKFVNLVRILLLTSLVVQPNWSSLECTSDPKQTSPTSTALTTPRA